MVLFNPHGAKPYIRRDHFSGGRAHAIVDNYAAHKHPEVKVWLADHPCLTMHFTPTPCSCLNTIESFFSKLTRQSIRRGGFRLSIHRRSQRTITRYIAHANKRPKPFAMHFFAVENVAWRRLPERQAKRSDMPCFGDDPIDASTTTAAA